ncbi:MAG: hypothetical protein ACJ741_12650 [Pyrinomonadaceae bacterium]
MRRKFVAVLAALALFTALSLAAAAKANFGGTWVMDAAKSEGMPPGLEQTLTVKQDGDKIETNVKIKSPLGRPRDQRQLHR